MPSQEGKARFIPPMPLQRVLSLPEGPAWAYGHQGQWQGPPALNSKYPGIAKALLGLPDETVIDGEVVALDETGRPSFNSQQNVGSSKLALVYYFDVLILSGRNLMAGRSRSAAICYNAESCRSSASPSASPHS